MCRGGGHLLRRVPSLAREDFMLYQSILNQRFCFYIVHGEALFDARAYVGRVFSNNQTGGGFYWLPVQHTTSTYGQGKTSFLTMVMGTFVFLLLTFAEASLLYLSLRVLYLTFQAYRTRKNIHPGHGCQSDILVYGMLVEHRTLRNRMAKVVFE